jgi:hypothetical protein
VSTADKIGLLAGLGWIAGFGFFATLLISWLITPGAMIVIAPIGESRWLPLRREHQFRSFFPGDLYLGLMAAGLLTLADRLPAGERLYNNVWWHAFVFAAACTIAFILTRQEYKGNGGVYELGAIFSPTKLYHNGVLYAGYGYVIVTTLMAVVIGSDWTWSFAGWLALTLLPGVFWLRLVGKDNSLGDEESRRKASTAHDSDWRILPANRWHVRSLKRIEGRWQLV